MSQITVYYRVMKAWRSDGVRWQGPAEPLTYTTDADRWYRLTQNEKDRVLERVTMMDYPEIDRIDYIAIEGTR